MVIVMMMKNMMHIRLDDHDDSILEARGTELCTEPRIGLSNKKLVCIWRRELRSDNEIFMIQIKYIAQ